MTEAEGIVIISSDEAFLYKQLRENKFFDLHGMEKSELVLQPEESQDLSQSEEHI